MNRSQVRSVGVFLTVLVGILVLGLYLNEAFRKPAEEHTHGTGDFGGFIVPVGKDHYHAEIIVDQAGLLKIYMRGREDSNVIDIESQTLEVYVRRVDETASTKVLLEPKPRPNDREGRTSYFEGKLPEGAAYSQLYVAVPEILMNGERYRFHFITAVEEHGPQMPAQSADTAENDLYLTPGGVYTAADIEANGGQTASRKYAGFKSKHDLFPQAGDPICPITQSKANAACRWIVGGKTYTFCCPPCIDEFVKRAKHDPAKIAPPESYVKQ